MAVPRLAVFRVADYIRQQHLEAFAVAKVVLPGVTTQIHCAWEPLNIATVEDNMYMLLEGNKGG